MSKRILYSTLLCIVLVFLVLDQQDVASVSPPSIERTRDVSTIREVSIQGTSTSLSPGHPAQAIPEYSVSRLVAPTSSLQEFPQEEAHQGSMTADISTTSSYQYFSVVSVVDGDTLKIDHDGTIETLRLIGIDTPETVDPRKPVQCFGREASQKAKELLSGQRVRIEPDASQEVRDKYGRLLVYLFRSDGLFFNEYMIREGYAHEYTYNIPYHYQSEFRAAERSAREEGKGLWAPGVCESAPVSNVPPLETTPVTTPVSTITPVTTTAPSSLPGNYVCSSNVYNCTDFSTQKEAQAAFDACGGVGNDIHRLDSDKDGIPCESLP